MNGSVSSAGPMRKWAFTKALQVLAFSNVKGKDLTLIPLADPDSAWWPEKWKPAEVIVASPLRGEKKMKTCVCCVLLLITASIDVRESRGQGIHIIAGQAGAIGRWAVHDCRKRRLL